MCREILRLYLKHDYLLDGDLLKQAEKQTFNDIINNKADSTNYADSLKRISEYLYRYHHQKTVILIDEYDTPIQAGYKKFYDDAISFMRNLMSGAFKDNIYLYKGVITGILRISKESIFTGLNNVSVFSVLDDELSDKFGFTENEVNKSCKILMFQLNMSKLKSGTMVIDLETLLIFIIHGQF